MQTSIITERVMDTIKVVCGIIFDKGKVFICRRKQGKSLEGFWEFPGGKIEVNETHQDALKRELLEELDMDIELIDFVGQSNYDYGDFQIELYGYVCHLINYQGKLTDHDSFVWTDVSRLSEFKLAPADIPLIKILKNKQGATLF